MKTPTIGTQWYSYLIGHSWEWFTKNYGKYSSDRNATHLTELNGSLEKEKDKQLYKFINKF